MIPFKLFEKLEPEDLADIAIGIEAAFYNYGHKIISYEWFSKKTADLWNTNPCVEMCWRTRMCEGAEYPVSVAKKNYDRGVGKCEKKHEWLS